MIIEEDQGTGKAVVFSQMKSTIDHMGTVLEEEGISFVKITRGDSQTKTTRAVARFNSKSGLGTFADYTTDAIARFNSTNYSAKSPVKGNGKGKGKGASTDQDQANDQTEQGDQMDAGDTIEGAHVFLLQASSAAAGLTLTAARHVLLMEPFLRKGEEEQALNRCHRIGQSRQVCEHIYYSRGTIDERLLLWRSNQEIGDEEQEQEQEQGQEQEQTTSGLAVLSGEAAGTITSLSPAMLRYLAGVSQC